MSNFTDVITDKSNQNLRKRSEGLLRAEYRSRNYNGPKETHNMTALIHIFRAAAPGYNLSANAVTLMGILFSSLTVEKDFRKGKRALTWIKTRTIMRRANWNSKKTYTRARKELEDAGLLCFKDSPNGVRRGKRCKNGYIIEAQTYGFDLTPLAAAYDTMVKIAAEYNEKEEAKHLIKRNYICAKHEFAELIQQSTDYITPDDIEPSMDAYHSLLLRYKNSGKDFSLKSLIVNKLFKLIEALKTKLSDIILKDEDPVLEALTNDKDKMVSYLAECTPKSGQIDPPIIPIPKPSPDSCKGLSGKEKGENPVSKTPTGYLAKKLASIKQTHKPCANTQLSDFVQKPSYTHVKTAMPFEIARHLKTDHGFFEMFDLVKQKAPSCGIDTLLLSQGRATMGLEITCGAMAIIFNRPDINKPAAYFKGMIKKHKINQLNVRGSLIGIIKGRSKPKTSKQYGLSYG